MPWSKDRAKNNEQKRRHRDLHRDEINAYPFDEDPSLLFVASHWTNLQPMWALDNVRKSNRFAA